MEFRDFLAFDKFVAPVLIKVAYWIGLFFIVLSTIGGIFGMGSMMGYGYGGGGFSVGGAILAIIGGLLCALVWRVVYEIWIVIFSINDRLGIMTNQSGKTPNVP